MIRNVPSLRPQHLAEVEIPMSARAHSKVVAELVVDLVDPSEIVVAPPNERLCFRRAIAWKVWRGDLSLEQSE